MKKIAFWAALIAFIGCNSVENIHAPDVEKWKLKNRIANRMMKRDSTCGFLKPCDTAQPYIVDPNTKVFNDLLAKYILKEIPARYIKINKKDYGKLRDLKGNSTKVEGYKTTIYEAVSKAGPLLPTKAYYDIVTICPPPHPCPADKLIHK